MGRLRASMLYPPDNGQPSVEHMDADRREDRAMTPADAAEARQAHLGAAPRLSRDRIDDGEVPNLPYVLRYIGHSVS
jgi:hypothetical protein